MPAMPAMLAVLVVMALAGCTCDCPCRIAKPFDQEMPRTILATLEVYGSQSVETNGLLAIYDVSTDTVADKAVAAGKDAGSITYHYSALLRDARMTMLPQGNMMLDRGVLYVHARKIVGPIVMGSDATTGTGAMKRFDASTRIDGPGPASPTSLPLQVAVLAIAWPSIVTTPTNAMITWVPMVVRPPIRAITVGTDFIVQAIEGANASASIVRVFLISKDSKIAIEPDPWNGAGDPPVVHLESPKKYFEVIGQNFASGVLRDMTAEQQAFVDEVRKDAERLGVE